MRLINKVVTIFLIFCVIVLSFYVFEPLLYNGNSNGKEVTNVYEAFKINQSVYKYVKFYVDGDIESIKNVNSIYRVKDDETYSKISEIIKNDYHGVIINSAKRCFNGVYVIEYSYNTDFNEHILDTPNSNKIVLKIKDNKVKVYYDSLTKML